MSATERLRVLFVDDEQRVLSGLRRQFRYKKDEWELSFATSGDEALSLMEQSPAHVAIADLHMPDCRGGELLRKIRENWPATTRFVLTGSTNHTDIMSDIGVVHQVLQKPCDASTIERAIARFSELSSYVESNELRSMIASLQSLPVISQAYLQLVELLEDDACDANAVCRIVERDVGLSAKLMQMVNSAFFGLPRRVSLLKEAIVLVGTSNIKELALTSQIFDALTEEEHCKQTISRLWETSADIGVLAEKIARANGRGPDVRNAARLAGTLCLVGRAVLARMLPEKFEQALAMSEESHVSLSDAETMIIGAPQHYIGAYALGLWAFDDEIIETLARQFEPEQSDVTTPDHPLAYVHLARATHQHGQFVEPVKTSQEWIDTLGIRRATNGATDNAA